MIKESNQGYGILLAITDLKYPHYNTGLDGNSRSQSTVKPYENILLWFSIYIQKTSNYFTKNQ